MCTDSENAYSIITGIELALLLFAVLTHGIFAWMARRDPTGKRAPVFFDSIRQLVCIATFTAVFILLHANNTWKYFKDNCDQTSGWDHESIDTCAQLLAYIAVGSYLWSAVADFLDMHVTGLASFFVHSYVLMTFLSGLFAGAVILVGWYHPETVWRDGVLTHLSSGMFSFFLLVGYCVSQWRQMSKFYESSAKAGVIHTAHERAKEDEEKTNDTQELITHTYTSAGFNFSQGLFGILRLCAFGVLIAAWQMLYENDYHPSGDRFNFSATCQLAYNFVVITFCAVVVFLNAVHIIIKYIGSGISQSVSTGLVAKEGVQGVMDNVANAGLVRL